MQQTPRNTSAAALLSRDHRSSEQSCVGPRSSAGSDLFSVLGVIRALHPSSLRLVERYIPSADLDELAAAVGRVARSCADMHRATPDLRYLSSIYVPEDDTCFGVFHTASVAGVRAVNETADFRIDRISSGFGMDTSLRGESPTRSFVDESLAPTRKRLQ